MLSFNFDASKGETPASIAQKRALIAQLMGAPRSPSTLGEGFSALGDGIVANVEGGRARDAETKGQASANSTFSALTGMLTGEGGQTPARSYGGAPASVPSSADAASIRAGLIKRGLPEHVADGFLMNFQDESGFNSGINEAEPTVPGSRGGYGLYQLTGPRRVAYEQYAQQLGVDPSNVDAQLDFMMSELQGPEARAAKSIFAAPDAGSAAAAIATNFLRPAKEHLDARVSRYTGGGAAAPVQVASLDPSIGAPAQLPPIGPTGGPPLTAMPQQTAQAAPMAAPAPQQAAPAPVQTAQGPSLQMLMEAAANPWLNDSQKAIINTMIEQEMQRQDPRYQQELRAGDLGIQKAEIELEALRNAPPPLPDAPKTVTMFDPATGRDQVMQWNAQVGEWQPLGGVAGPDEPLVQVNTGDGAPGLGKLSTDFGYVLDPETGLPKIDPVTGLPTAAPVPGSPAAIAAEQAAASASQGSETRGTYADIVTEDIGRALTILEQDPTFTTGMFGAALGNWKGSNADRLDQLLNTVRSNVSFDRLQLMRESSPTGGALGSVTEKELTLLQSAIGSLERSDPRDLAYNLKRVQEIYDRVMEKASAYPNASQFGFGGATPNQSTVDPNDIDALLELYK